MARRDDMQVVGIDDRPAPIRAAGPRWWRRRWPLVAAGIVGVVSGLLAVQSGLDANERSRISRVRALPGVVRPLTSSVHELWSSDPTTTTISAGAVFAGRFIAGALDPDGTQRVQALDATTGAVAWSLAVTGPDPSAGSVHPEPPLCSLAQRVVLCLVKEDYAPATGTISPGSATPRRARVVVVDAATGAFVAERTTPVSSTLAVEAGLAVIGWVAGDAHGVVTATDPLTGDVRWTFTTPAPLEARAGEMLGLNVTAVDSGIVVSSWSNTLWLLSPRGALLRGLPTDGGSTRIEAPRRGMLALRTPGGPSGARTTVLVNGQDTRTFEGGPDVLTVDDGSAAGLVFTGGAPLVAWDVATGERRWTSTATTGHALILLDGTLYSATSDAVVAVDAATGRVRWTSPADLRANAGVLFTDGRVLVTDELNPRAHLQAFDPANGEQLWSSDLRTPVDNLVEVHGRLFGSVQDLELIALG